MARQNPLELQNAINFWAWAISDNGLQVSLYWPVSPYLSPLGTLRFHLSDQADAMHVLVTRAAQLPTPPRPPVVIEGLVMEHASLTYYTAAEVALPSALGNRPIVDATEGLARPQVSSGHDFSDRFYVGNEGSSEAGTAAFARFALSEQRRWPKARWSYGHDNHEIVDFVAPPGSPHESRSVPVTAFNREV